MSNKEIRTIECELQVREVEGDKQCRTIEGTAIVFNRESEVLIEDGMRFREVILPSCVTPEFLATQDIKLNVAHNREKTIGRSNCGRGNMTLTIDAEGLHFSIPVNEDNMMQREVVAMIADGILTGCSFEFYVGDYEVTERETAGRPAKIVHKNFRSLDALTIAIDPAYRQTSVCARSLTEDAAALAGADEQAEREQRQHEADDRRRELARIQREVAINYEY